MRGLVVLLVLSLALAGCTKKDEPAEDVRDLPNDAAAQATLARAARELPDVFSLAMNATTTSGQTIRFAGTFDNVSQTTFLEMGGDPRLLESLATIAGAGTYLTHGLSIYVTPAAAAYVANGSAYVYVEDPDGQTTGSLLPNPRTSPLGALLRGDEIIRGYASEDIRVTNVSATTWQGAPAQEMVAQSVRKDTRFTVAKLTVLDGEPPRIVHVRATLNGTGPADPLANATVEGDLLYEASERIEPTTTVERAVALAYRNEKVRGDERNLTWSFVGAGGIRLAELQIQVKTPAANGTATVDPGNLATAWVMPLDALTRTEGNVTLTFTDADLDGELSAGDTFRATSTGGPLPPMVLYDTQTALRVVPLGWAVLATALALAIALRRRSF